MPARLGKEPLSRDRVLEAAMALADSHGLGAITMRRVAEALDCEAMSLYHYVADKKTLLAGLTEVVIGEIAQVSLRPPPDAVGDDRPADWREVIRGRCLAARQVMQRHPWAPALVSTQADVPPTVYPVFEGLVATMVEAGCSYDLAHRAIHSLGSLLFGFTQELFEPSAEDPGTSPEEMRAMAEAMPHLTRLAEVTVHDDEGALSVCDTQAEFEFTLALILDGLEAHRRQDARRRSRSGRSARSASGAV